MAQVIIASRLSDGLVVFLSKASATGATGDSAVDPTVDWALRLEDAAVFEEDDLANERLAAAEADVQARHEVLDPYLIEVTEEGGALRPTKYREAIRCLGPTIRKDLGKQAEGSEA